MQLQFTSIYTFTLTHYIDSAYRFSSKAEAEDMASKVDSNVYTFKPICVVKKHSKWVLRDLMQEVYIREYKYELYSCIQNATWYYSLVE